MPCPVQSLIDDFDALCDAEALGVLDHDQVEAEARALTRRFHALSQAERERVVMLLSASAAQDVMVARMTPAEA